MRTNCSDTENISRKLNSTVCCSPGRAAKGANPAFCARESREAFCPLCFLYLRRKTGFEGRRANRLPFHASGWRRSAGDAPQSGALVLVKHPPECHKNQNIDYLIFNKSIKWFNLYKSSSNVKMVMFLNEFLYNSKDTNVPLSFESCFIVPIIRMHCGSKTFAFTS